MSYVSKAMREDLFSLTVQNEVISCGSHRCVYSLFPNLLNCFDLVLRPKKLSVNSFFSKDILSIFCRQIMLCWSCETWVHGVLDLEKLTVVFRFIVQPGRNFCKLLSRPDFITDLYLTHVDDSSWFGNNSSISWKTCGCNSCRWASICTVIHSS